MASPLQNGTTPFGMPMSQVQPNYVYVPSVTLSQPLGDPTSPFLLEQQTMPKMPNVMGMSKLPNIQQQHHHHHHHPQQHHELHLASLELNIQPNVTDSMTLTHHHPSLQQNFQLVPPTVLPENLHHSFEESIDKRYEEQQQQPPPLLQVMIEEKRPEHPVKTEEDEDDVEKLRSSVAEVKETSHVWKAVRERILSQCRLWDLLLDKASFSYFYDTKAKKLPKDNLRKYRAVVKEIEDLLGEFKCFMDACLHEDKENVNVLSLGPELSRAYEVIPGKAYTIKDQDAISPYYRSFFTSNEVLNEDLTLDLPYIDGRAESNEESGDELLGHYDYNNTEEAFDDESEKKPHVCQRCGKSYSRRLNLTKHLEKCPSLQLMPTEHCQWHKRPEDGQVICDFNHCHEAFNEMISLWTHFQDEHALPEDFVFRCTHCQLAFVHPDLLKAHKRSVHNEQPETVVNSQPKRIKKEPLDTNAAQYKCDLCHFSTTAQNGLSLHKRRLHKIDKNNEAVTQLDNPDFHNRDPKKFRHECLRCTRRYKKIHHLERHQSKCDGIPPPTFKPMWTKNDLGRFVCTVPGCTSEKSWTSSFSVWHHFNSEHADMQDDSYCVFKCDMCEKKFPNKSMLTRHRNHKHEALFRFQCSKCSKRLASNKLLKLHMTQHTGEKPFSCDFCDYKAITQSIVNQHKMRMHEGSIPDKVLPKHVCDICGKSFKVRSNLKEHIQTHTDTRSFLCGMCGKSLKNRQCLNRHLFTHGVKQTCQICNKNFANASSLSIHQRDKHGLAS